MISRTFAKRIATPFFIGCFLRSVFGSSRKRRRAQSWGRDARDHPESAASGLGRDGRAKSNP